MDAQSGALEFTVRFRPSVATWLLALPPRKHPARQAGPPDLSQFLHPIRQSPVRRRQYVRPANVPPLALHRIAPGESHTYVAGPDSPIWANVQDAEIGGYLQTALRPINKVDELLSSRTCSGWGSDAGDVEQEKGYTNDLPYVDIAVESLIGDYMFRTLDGRCENLLRLQESGQWWHAAHRTEPERAWSSGTTPAHDDPWEQAEALGSWQRVELPGRRGGGIAVLLSCEGCRWTSDFDHPRLRPLADAREELDRMVNRGLLQLVYAVRRDVTTGRATLELLMQHDFAGPSLHFSKSIRATRAAVDTLGFRMVYGKGAAVAGVPEHDEAVLAAAEAEANAAAADGVFGTFGQAVANFFHTL